MNVVPWNAPATLALAPTVSMLAAGNHAGCPLRAVVGARWL